MKYRFFHIPSAFAESQTEALNQFLNQHAIIDIEKRFVEQGDKSFWSFCITWIDHTENQTATAHSKKTETKIDYRETLSEENFKLYSQLRSLRKQLAEQEGVPPYYIFNNEQLAQIVEQKITQKNQLEAIHGVGQQRIEKYGHAFLSLMTRLLKNNTP